MQVFLIGFMGSGKTTVGLELAKQLGIHFTDSDEWIEERTGKTISAIFSEDGEVYFRKLEQEFVSSLPDVPAIIACGGGLPCFNNLLQILQQKGTVIYLETGVETLVERLLSERAHRPLLMGFSLAELPEVIRKRLVARTPVYKQADWTVDTNGKTTEEIVVEIRGLLQK